MAQQVSRRTVLGLIAAGALVPRTSAAAEPVLHVAKTPTCGCCADWVAHMAAAGFATRVEDMDQGALIELKLSLGIGPAYASCHTARIDGYVIEGHVPAADVRRLLAERPEALGLAVPGMPIGSPGMEVGARREPFDTLLLIAPRQAEVFASHG